MHWLTALGALPILGALVLCAPVKNTARQLGMAFSLATLALGAYVAWLYLSGTKLDVLVPWIPAIGANWALGLDGMGLTMALLPVVLTPLVLLAEWNTGALGGRWSPRAFFGLVLLLEGLSVFVFLATDVLLFYLFFEATLIPMYFLIGGFGAGKRGLAANKFLLMSLAGGLVMLVSVIGLYGVSASAGAPTYLLSDLAALHIGGDLGRWLFIGFMVAFAVKAPMVPVHSWLPDACESATPGTSVLLVGVLDKISTFGMLRFCLGLFGEAAQWATPVVVTLAVISILYGAVAAVASKHLMRLIAFTSISHFGFMVLGVFAFTSASITGSMFYMVNHGFSTAAMFLVIGFVIRRRGSAQVADFGGVEKVAPVLAGLVLVSGLSVLSLPGYSTFVSEFMVLAGAWSQWPWVAAIACLGMVLSALYVLLMYQRTMTGPPSAEVAKRFGVDATALEKWVLAPIIAVLLLFGFFPKPITDLVEPTARALMSYVSVSDPAPVVVKEAK